MLIIFFVYLALDDSVLVGILKKGCINLKSIDFSASPYVITKHSFFMIGELKCGASFCMLLLPKRTTNFHLMMLLYFFNYIK